MRGRNFGLTIQRLLRRHSFRSSYINIAQRFNTAGDTKFTGKVAVDPGIRTDVQSGMVSPGLAASSTCEQEGMAEAPSEGIPKDEYEVPVFKVSEETVDPEDEPEVHKAQRAERERAKAEGIEMWNITRRINEVLDTRPKVFMFSFVGIRAGSLGLFTYALLGVNLFTGTEFLSGWVIARVTSKFRQPLNLGMAHLLNKICPQLPLLNFSNMFLINVNKRIDEIYTAQMNESVPFGSKTVKAKRGRKPRLQECEKRNELRQKQADERKRQRLEWEKKSIVEKRVEQVYNEAFNVEMKKLMEKGKMPDQKKLAAMKDKLEMDKERAVQKIERSRRIRELIGAPMNSYGFSWYVCSKVSTVGTIFGCTMAIHYGFDLSWLLDSEDTFNQTTAAMGGAFLINTVLIPIHFLNAWHVTRYIDYRWPKVYPKTVF